MYSPNTGTSAEKGLQSAKFYPQWGFILTLCLSSFYYVCEITRHLGLLQGIPCLGLKKKAASQLFSYIRSTLEGLTHFGKDDLRGIATEIQSVWQK